MAQFHFLSRYLAIFLSLGLASCSGGFSSTSGGGGNSIDSTGGGSGGGGTGGSVTPPPAVNTVGLLQMGVPGMYTFVAGSSADPSGNAFVAGSTQGGLKGNSQSGYTDLYLAKYNSAGALIWLKQAGATAGWTMSGGVAADPSGNAFVAGYTNVKLGTTAQKGLVDFIVAKYDSSGNQLWLAQTGVAGGQSLATCASADNGGNGFVAGNTDTGLSGNSQTGHQDVFVAKYSSSGTLAWLKQLGGTGGYAYAKSIAVDTAGNIFVTGYTTAGLGGNAQIGNEDFFVAKYSSSGSIVWLKELGVKNGQSYGSSVAVDTSGNIILGGYTDSGLSGNTQSGAQDFFVAKYNTSGTLQWLKQTGKSGGWSNISGVGTDSSSNIFVTGYTNVSLASTAQTGVFDFFVGKYGLSGSLLWMKQGGAHAGYSYGQSVSADPSGNAFVTGYTNLGLSGNPQTGVQDIFVVKYAP